MKVNAVRDGNESGDQLEIGVIQSITNRAIIIIRSDANPIIPDALDSYRNPPIFLYHSILNHYETLLIGDNKDASTILSSIQMLLRSDHQVKFNPLTQSVEYSLPVQPSITQPSAQILTSTTQQPSAHSSSVAPVSPRQQTFAYTSQGPFRRRSPRGKVSVPANQNRPNTQTTPQSSSGATGVTQHGFFPRPNQPTSNPADIMSQAMRSNLAPPRRTTRDRHSGHENHMLRNKTPK